MLCSFTFLARLADGRLAGRAVLPKPPLLRVTRYAMKSNTRHASVITVWWLLYDDGSATRCNMDSKFV